MMDRMKSFVMGMLQGLVSRAQFPKGEPVAYLYNGIRLPKLPEWDRVKYPYAVIAYDALYDYYQLWVCSIPMYVSNTGTVGATVGTEYLLYNTYGNPSTWGYLGESVQEATGTWTFRAKWTNHDLSKEDGTVYLAASEPIPVYE